MSPLLPTHWGTSAPQNEATLPSSSHSVSTRAGDEEKIRSSEGSEGEDRTNLASNEYEEKGIKEIEEGGDKRQVMVVFEQKSGKELEKPIEEGPFTQPRWYVCFHLLESLSADSFDVGDIHSHSSSPSTLHHLLHFLWTTLLSRQRFLPTSLISFFLIGSAL